MTKEQMLTIAKEYLEETYVKSSSLDVEDLWSFQGSAEKLLKFAERIHSMGYYSGYADATIDFLSREDEE